MNPERMAMNNIDRGREKRFELSPMMIKAHEKAENEILSNPDYVIQESEFAQGEHPVYRAEDVASDIALGNRLHKQFEDRQSSQDKNTKKIADIFEAMVLMEGEQSNWLGDATTLKSSRYDDYVNKVDMVAEWNSPEAGSQLLALGVDVTYGQMGIEKKIAAIKEEIDRGKLGSMRYFKDSRGDFMGTRNNIPRTVIGVSQPVVEQLAGLWITKEHKALAAHPVQLMLARQMTSQLLAMREYASKRANHLAANSYNQSLQILKKVAESKSHLELGTLREDPVWQEILSQTRQQFKS